MILRCTGFSDVTQATLVIGIRGSLNEKEWREQLAPLGLTTAQFNDLRKMAVAGAVKAASDIWRARNVARSELQAITAIGKRIGPGQVEWGRQSKEQEPRRRRAKRRAQLGEGEPEPGPDQGRKRGRVAAGEDGGPTDRGPTYFGRT